MRQSVQIAFAATVVATAMAVIAWWWRSPALVADHASAFGGTAVMSFAGVRTVSQLVIPRRDGLARVDALIAAESPALPGRVRLTVEEWPLRRVTRSVELQASGLPVGSPWDLRLGQANTRWTSFGFEPVADSSGREYLLRLSYGDGVDEGGSRLATLARFPRTYPWGDILLNDLPSNGTLVFRLSASGSHGDAVRSTAANLARAQPVARGTLALPAALAAIGAGLLAWTAVATAAGSGRT
jgi:hypothetical protein